MNQRNSERHDLQVTRRFYYTLAEDFRGHLTCRLVDELEPIVQGYAYRGSRDDSFGLHSQASFNTGSADAV